MTNFSYFFEVIFGKNGASMPEYSTTGDIICNHLMSKYYLGVPGSQNLIMKYARGERELQKECCAMYSGDAGRQDITDNMRKIVSRCVSIEYLRYAYRRLHDWVIASDLPADAVEALSDMYSDSDPDRDQIAAYFGGVLWAILCLRAGG